MGEPGPVFGLIGVASRATARWGPGPRALAIAAAVFAGETAIGRVWWGVPAGLLGVSQRGAIGVAQLAAVAGVPLISALLVASNCALADLGRKRAGAAQLALALGASWLALAHFGLPVAEAMRPHASTETVDLLLVQPDLPRGERWNDALQPLHLHRVRAFADRAVARETTRIDALVLPENLLTARVDGSRELSASLLAWVDELGIPVLTGLVMASSAGRTERYRSSVVWLEPERGITARLDKARAIPLLESSRRFPGDALLVRLFGGAAAWNRVEEVEGPPTFRGPVRVAPLLCYEVLFPGIAARRRTPAAFALVNLADDSWLQSAAARRQLLELARFRAIEQRLALVRVAHGGLSAVVDEFGRVRDELPQGTWSARRISLRPPPPPDWRERAALLALPAAAFGVARCAYRYAGTSTPRRQ